MDQISRIGTDIEKRVFQLHGVNAAEEVVLRRKLRRKEMVAFFEKLAPTVIAIEACGARHHWTRLLHSFGHTVKLIPPQLVKPYVKRSKNDAADAEALYEAMSRPTMRFVPVKSPEQQAALMLTSVRDRLIRNCTQLANAVRGHAAEFGLTAAKGMAHLVPLLDRIQADESLPTMARKLFAMQAKEYEQMQTQIDEVDAQLLAQHRADECSRRLEDPRHRPGRRDAAEDEDAGARAVPIRPAVCSLDRLDAQRSLDRRQGEAGRHHASRRRGAAQRAGGWGNRCDPARSTSRKGVALAGRAAQAQVAEAGRRGTGQQNGACRVEADANRGGLHRNACARCYGWRGLEIGQTRGAPELQPC